MKHYDTLFAEVITVGNDCVIRDKATLETIFTQQWRDGRVLDQFNFAKQVADNWRGFNATPTPPVFVPATPEEIAELPVL